MATREFNQFNSLIYITPTGPQGVAKMAIRVRRVAAYMYVRLHGVLITYYWSGGQTMFYILKIN